MSQRLAIPSLNNKLYEFGNFSLDAQNRTLRRGEATVPLTPKAFDVLLVLVQNAGKTVSKDELIKAVWPDSFVEESNLTQTVFMVRKALDETADRRYVLTVQGRGYRFTAAVKLTTQPDAEPTTVSTSLRDLGPADPTAIGVDHPGTNLHYASRAAISRNRIVIPAFVLLFSFLAGAAYLAFRKPSATRSLAILPLRNLRHDPDSDFLSFSLADAVISKLGFLGSVTIRPSWAIEKYKGREIDIKKVAAELNVDTLLTGNFIRDGDRLRVTYQLVEVRGCRILSKDVIDLKYDELLSVHDNVARRIVHGLQLNLSPLEAARIRSSEPVNLLAYEYYLRGVDLMASHNFGLAIKMLEKSAEIDPTYSLTWAYLGQSYTSDATFELGGRAQYRKARAAYERALVLQPKQLEAEMFYANLLIDTGNVEKAVPLLRDAIDDNPNDAAVHWELGYAYRFAGVLEQSLAECERALRIDPLVKSNGSALNTYLYLGQYDNFLHSLPDVNESAFFGFYRGFGEYHEGKMERAAEDFVRAYKEEPTLYTRIGKAFADSIAKNTLEGLAILAGLESEIQQRGVGDAEASYKIAQAYAALGDQTSAIRMLHSSIESGFFSYPYFVRDPLLNTFRSLPEFARLMDAARQRHEAFKKKFF